MKPPGVRSGHTLMAELVLPAAGEIDMAIDAHACRVSRGSRTRARRSTGPSRPQPALRPAELGRDRAEGTAPERRPAPRRLHPVARGPGDHQVAQPRAVEPRRGQPAQQVSLSPHRSRADARRVGRVVAAVVGALPRRQGSEEGRAVMLPRIVIVGGGAGGLELATRLGDTLGRRGRAQVTLVDRTAPTSGSRCCTRSPPAAWTSTTTSSTTWRRRTGTTSASARRDGRRSTAQRARSWSRRVADEEGREITARARAFRYDTLVLAIGSESPTTSARRACASTRSRSTRAAGRTASTAGWSTPASAPTLSRAARRRAAPHRDHRRRRHRRRARRRAAPHDARAGRPSGSTASTPSATSASPDRGRPAHPAGAARARRRRRRSQLLQKLGVDVRTGEKVIEVTADGVRLASGGVPADLVVWAAGVSAPTSCSDLDGLETNRINQLVVLPTLQTTRDPDIFAIGDCAACPWQGDGATVPPRAQAAHQEASHLVKQLRAPPRRQAARALTATATSARWSRSATTTPSAISWASSRARNSASRAGSRASFYVSLYRQHIWALHGFWRMALIRSRAGSAARSTRK